MSGISIKLKIIGAVLSVALLFIAIGIYPILAVKESVSKINLSREVITYSQDLILKVSDFFGSTIEYIYIENREGYISRWGNSLYEIEGVLADLEGLKDFNSYSIELIGSEITLGEKISEDLILNHDLLLIANSEDKKELLQKKEYLYINSINEIEEKLKKSLYELISNANDAFSGAIDSQNNALRLSEFYLSIFLIISVLIALLISGSITRPVIKLVEATKNIKERKFGTYLKTSSTDEIGILTDSFNTMSHELEKSENDINLKINELESEKKKLNTILNSIGDGVFAVDANGKIIFLNKTTERYSHYSAIEIRGKNYKDFLNIIQKWDDQKEINVIEEVLKSKKSIDSNENTFLFFNKRKALPIVQNSSVIIDAEGKVTGVIVTFRDITKIKEVDRLKSDFVSIASHQLRTPISAMKWFTEILMDEDVGTLNDKQKELLRGSYESMIRMNNLIDGLLNISRIETEKVELDIDKINMDRFFKRIYEDFKKMIFDKQIEFNYINHYGDLELETDENILREIIVNLLTNAIKFTKTGGKISIKIELMEGGIKFIVTDNGYGIPKEQIKDIFTKFTRGSNIVKIDTEGKGIGLYISKRLAKFINAELSFESKENEGTEFCLSLPFDGQLKSKKGKKIISTIL